MRRVLLLLIAVAPLLVGCGTPIDSEQLRVCRDVVPALNPDDAEIRELRSAAGLDLIAVETESGALGDARLYFLKRFWLGASPDAGATLGAEPAVPVLPPSLAYVAQQFINAIAL